MKTAKILEHKFDLICHKRDIWIKRTFNFTDVIPEEFQITESEVFVPKPLQKVLDNLPIGKESDLKSIIVALNIPGSENATLVVRKSHSIKTPINTIFLVA